jgi:phage terminase large subunit-like protein
MWETESYVDVADVQAGKVNKINWEGREVFLGLDLAMTNDNCAVAMAAEESGEILADVIAFVPEDQVEEKSKVEKIDYQEFIQQMKCVACGGQMVDYGVIEETILTIEETYGVTVVGISYDRYNCLSTAMKLEREGYQTVEVRQHSSVLHPATKLL